MVSQVAPGGYQGVSICVVKIFYFKNQIFVWGVRIYPSQVAPVAPPHRPISAKIDVQDMPPLAMILDIIAVGYYNFPLIVV